MQRSAAVLLLVAALLPVAFAEPVTAGPGDASPGATYIFDKEAVFRLYLMAAEQGDAAAQVLVANMYRIGEGVQRDSAEAIRWYEKAAEQGNADAQYNLGLMHADGEGVPRSNAEAARWYRRAADQGIPDAQYDLGVQYANGDGVPKDLVAAYVYLDLAARNFGTADARETAAGYRDFVAAKLPPAERARAKDTAREWKPNKER